MMAVVSMLTGCDAKSVSGEVARVEALADSAWDASEWISCVSANPITEKERAVQRAPDGTSVFWKRVKNSKSVKRARWMTAGLGVYALYLNGKLIDLDPLKPGFTDRNNTKYSFTYDVTAAVRSEAGATNDFAVEVGNGWRCDRVVGYIGKKPAFRGVIELVYDDGSTELIGTKAAEWYGECGGPVLHSGIFDGEEFDARKTDVARTPPAEFVSGGCEVNNEFTGKIFPTAGAEITYRRDLEIVRGPYTIKPGEELVIDFGQNCSGVPCFEFSSKPGTMLVALPGEMLNDAEKGQHGCDGPKGSVYRANLRMPSNGMKVVYYFKGEGVETYMPRFTFFGYRYLSVTATDEVTINKISLLPVTSITKEMETGKIETGVKDINRLIANVYWGQLSNYLSVPTDCPQRDERQGWAADTQVFAEAGSFNANTDRFFHKWMRDVRDSQRSTGAFTSVAPEGAYGGAGQMRLGWQDAGVIVPYQIWKQFGDTSIIEENWSAMEKFMAHLAETKMDYDTIEKECDGFQYADWLSYENFESCSGRGCWSKKKIAPKARDYFSYLGACYWLWDSEMMATMAKAIGKDSAVYEKMAIAARAYIKERFFAAADGLILEPFRDMQTPALFALKFGLVEGEARKKTMEALCKNIKDHGDCLQTGFLGTSILMDTLTANGMTDIAYTLLLQHKNPSWLYSVDQGATTIWERWNSYTLDKGFGDVGMNSFNHYAYGAVLAWIYKTAAGIAADPAQPGFKNIIMKPIPDRRLGYVKAEFKSVNGLIKSAWKYEGDKWIWDFTIPNGATASVTLPGDSETKVYNAGTYHIEK